MHNKIALIVPYFGKLPNYFDLWMLSASYNSKFDFLIYTDSDDEILKMKYSNIIVKRTTFSDFSNNIKRLFNYPISLESPYKLCDYRPMYGHALALDLEKYTFWGHCDVDLIFGDLSKYITDDILKQYDRIYNHGHLTLYRNIPKMNYLYKIEHSYYDCVSYKYVCKTDFLLAFDEVGMAKYGYGISTICDRIGIKNYKNIDFADVNPDIYDFNLEYTNNEHIDYFVYNKGKLIGVSGDRLKEYAYVHLQKRSMDKKNMNSQFYYISPRCFRDNEEKTKNDNLSKMAHLYFYKMLIKRKLKSKLTKLKQGALIYYVNKKLRRINI